MERYEYKIIPAPAKGRKAPGVKGPEARFAYGLETAINAVAADGWEYLRADILPSEERQGLTSTHTVYRSVLVFRRALAADTQYPSRSIPDAMEQTDPMEDEEMPYRSEAYEETPESAPEGDREGETPNDYGRQHP